MWDTWNTQVLRKTDVYMNADVYMNTVSILQVFMFYNHDSCYASVESQCIVNIVESLMQCPVSAS